MPMTGIRLARKSAAALPESSQAGRVSMNVRMSPSRDLICPERVKRQGALAPRGILPCSDPAHQHEDQDNDQNDPDSA